MQITSAPHAEEAPPKGLSSWSIARYFESLLEPEKTEKASVRTIWVGVSLLILLCGIRMYLTWGAWGNLTIDSGRELYVPAVLREGRMLYRDVWYLYGPLAPYLNSILFRIFGVHLYVSYFAGALAALGSSIFLFLTGIELSFPWPGLAAGAVVLIEAFEPSLFCFPLPYSFASVYGCVVACALLWLLARGLASGRWIWMATCGMLASASLLLKLEFGAACYCAVVLAVLFRCFLTKDFRQLSRDIGALLPGIGICGLVIGWMISIRGTTFLIQENLATWPTSFFMRTYGKAWLGVTGLAWTWDAWREALLQTVLVAGVWVVGPWLVLNYRGRVRWRGDVLRVLLLLALFGYYRFVLDDPFTAWIGEAAFFPMAMVLYVLLAGATATVLVLVRRGGVEAAKVAVVLTFSGLIALRLLLKMWPGGYAIYYNGPVALCFLILLTVLLRREKEGLRSKLRPEHVVAMGCVAVVIIRVASFSQPYPLVPLRTDYGTVRISQQQARSYEAAIAFLKEKNAHGEAVLVLPEDTSLYFLSGMQAPSRVFAFVPGTVSPGAMAKEIIFEIESKRVGYLLWSNRTYPEYGVPEFGKDFDQELGTYLTTHYRRLGPLVPEKRTTKDSRFDVWERIGAVGAR